MQRLRGWLRIRLRNFRGIFLRVYLGILTALLAVSFLAILVVKAANQVRLEEYRERQADQVLITLSHLLQPLPKAQKVAWLQSQSDILGIEVALLSQIPAHLNAHQQQRLESGRTVVTPVNAPASSSLLAYRALPIREIVSSHKIPEEVLQVRFQRIDEQPLQVLLRLAQSQWQSIQTQLLTDPDAKEQALQHLNQALTYPLRLIALEEIPVGLDQVQEKNLLAGQLQIIASEAAYTGYLRPTSTSHTIFALGPVPKLASWPWTLLLGVGLMTVLLLGAAVYWQIRLLEQRLQKLEKAASHIASGNLNARVELGGQQDFIARLAAAFNRMAEQIQSLLNTQQDMIHAVSHELRTPVARIRFGLQILEDSLEQHPSLLAQLEGMDTDIQELDELVDEILTFARLGQNGLRLRFESCLIMDLVHEVVEAHQPLHPHLQLTVHQDRGAQDQGLADVEARYFQRAVQNLVGNACRYAHSQIQVYCWFEADSLRIDVEDDGPGIPEQDWQRVFTPFSRLDDSRTRASGGYGLGLSIVQRIMHWHRGSALIDRSPSLQGARFSLIYPRIQRRKEHPKSPAP
ncbi:two-component system, OmpR family, sensor histidine kinase RstB [Allopseudospirillum japonicum]|uniref:histidine kinase n=1 Tax=Allopseudospirillum japonicum TaxID=64971 RepID=A0A1H6TSB7_9GAMM|nr:ATP-binding protein [Allopseudospirillum japonicum]SEI82146.1 two-component system, OmpR family, sensor histidine kinase RstB [Allopseudospirillum japonicum]